ncbi:LOW QUALITY PROTEIN: sodium-dependent glucose transporter 1-like, partial [Uloborus diversus]|uniref:LOW QUALITY PROTEIN: sodium-dependent glucose transporter 1-like n=1 Tax=Uloborus diversus TaxID=327109 RepID=UPI00240A0F89
LQGMCFAIPGPTLLDLQHIRTDTEHIAFFYTGRSIEFLIGSLAVCNVFLLNLWGKESAPYYQALHFAFGLGGLLSPLIAAPFLRNYNELKSENEYSEKDEAKNGKRQNPLFFFAIVGLVFALLFIQTGAEIGYAQMLTPYAVKGKLKLTTATGSYMTSAFWAAFTVSRFLCVFLAIKLTSLTLIIYNFIVTSVAAAILTALSNYEWALWLSSVLYGIGIASFFPAAIAWFETHINVTNKIASIFVCSAAFDELAIPFIVRFNIETTPEVFIYVVPASCVCSGFIVLILYLIFRNKKPTLPVEKQHSSSNIDIVPAVF